MNLYLVKNFKKEDSRSLLHRALTHYSGGCHYRIAEGEHGKPYALGEDGKADAQKTPSFSISHSGKFWGCMIGTCEVGLDLEDRSLGRKRTDQVAQRFFHPLEHAYVQTVGMEQFLPLWVRKEAYIKCKGTGLSEGLKTFSVVKEQREEWDCDAKEEPGESAHFSWVECVDGYFIQSLELPRERREKESMLVGAVCSKEPIYVEHVIFLQAQSAKEAAVAYVQQREHSWLEVRTHLREKEYSVDEMEEAESFLREYGYVDDHRYGMAYMRAARRKGRGDWRIRQELMQKGLDRATIEHCVEQIAEEWQGTADFPGEYGEPPEDELERALIQGRKVLRFQTEERTPLTEKEKAKVGRKLAYLGYTSSITYQVIRILCQEHTAQGR